jgi:23S rRNA (cytosine1962-C5)-methyltransferase
VDASKTSVNWVRENLATSGMRQDSIRMIADDALEFAKREVRRGEKYAGILMDPPHYGRGPNGEKWQLEESLAELLDAARELLAPRSFCALSTYAVGYSPLAFTNMFGEFQGGVTEAGELVLPEGVRAGKGAGTGRLLPCGFCARWTRGFLANTSVER